MAFKVNFYNFKKNIKSTAIPTITPTVFDCTLKERTSILKPSLLLQIGITAAPISSNYCYIPDFGRYYFVVDWINDGLQWICDLISDPMASFKSDIGNSSQYILRCASEYDDNIVDSAYPTAGGYITTTTVIPVAGSAEGYEPFKKFVDQYADGIYIVGIINDESSGKVGGALSYYVMDHQAFKGMMSQILQNVDYLNVNPSEISPELLKVLVEPMQYIKSLLWFPIALSDLNTDDWPFFSKLNFGFWETGLFAGGRVLDVGIYKMVADLPLPNHPQVESEFSYLNLSPYRKLTLKFPPFGDIELDMLQMYSLDHVQIRIIIDFITGDAKLNIVKVDPLNDVILMSAQANVSVAMDIGDVFRGFDKTVKGGILGALQSVMEHPILGMAGDSNVLSKVKSSAGAGGGTALYEGSIGSICGYTDAPVLVAEFLEQVSINNRSMGKPLYKRRTISSLTGFVICQNPRVNIGGFDAEKKQIESYMESGFYYE